jgi:hypothetical protein
MHQINDFNYASSERLRRITMAKFEKVKVGDKVRMLESCIVSSDGVFTSKGEIYEVSEVAVKQSQYDLRLKGFENIGINCGWVKRCHVIIVED